MALIKNTFYLAFLSFIYFFFCGFFVLLLVNFFTRNMIWAFYENSLDISLINAVIASLGIWFSVKKISPIFKTKIHRDSFIPFVIASSVYMFVASVFSFFIIMSEMDVEAINYQIVNSIVLFVVFVVFSNYYFLKKKD